jgi:hypothetical protein
VSDATDRQRKIADLFTELTAEAGGLPDDVEATLRKVLESADIATLDQRKSAVRDEARIVAAYFNELVEQGVPEDEAGWLSRDQAEYVRGERDGD